MFHSGSFNLCLTYRKMCGHAHVYSRSVALDLFKAFSLLQCSIESLLAGFKYMLSVTFWYLSYSTTKQPSASEVFFKNRLMTFAEIYFVNLKFRFFFRKSSSTLYKVEVNKSEVTCIASLTQENRTVC